MGFLNEKMYKKIQYSLFFFVQILSFKFYFHNNLNNFNNLNNLKLYSKFDKDFAESISKPLPDWYLKEKNQIQNKRQLNDSNITIFRIPEKRKIEKKETKIIIPGFFDVFPELQLKWPEWKKKNGQRIECKIDKDCKFPQACCHHPIIPGNKYCCTGYKKRTLEPAYIVQVIQSNPNPNPKL